MKFTPTEIPEVLLIDLVMHSDARGFFIETYRTSSFEAHGIREGFVQHNHSGSRRGTLRGLHYQIRQPQGKLVRAVSGEVYDVSVDLRRRSPHFGRWVGVQLSEQNPQMLWVPPGFAHGFYVLSNWAEVSYMTTRYYAPEWERTLLWNDPSLSITWPLIDSQAPLLSEKDSRGKPLAEAETYDWLQGEENPI